MASFQGPHSSRPTMAERFARLPFSILATWAMAFAFIALLVGGWRHATATVEKHLQEHVLAVAQLAAERSALAFEHADLSLKSIIDSLRPGDFDHAYQLSRDRQAAIQALLALGQERNADLVSLVVADADGHVLASSPGRENATDSARKNYFLAIQQGTQLDTPVISAARHDPISGIWGVHMARRILGQDGQPIGALVAHLALEDGFVKFCRSQAFDEKDFIGLIDATNGLLAGYPTGRNFPASLADILPLNEVSAAQSTDDVHFVRSPADDVDRLVVVRKLPRYPFYVTYGRNIESLLTSWRYEKLLVALAAVLALILTFFVNAGIRRRLALTTQLQHVRGDLEESNDALRTALAATELLAAKDQLTGLWNRRSFDQRLEGAIAHLARHEGSFSLLLIDLDHFKSINDRCGHVGGDEVLKRFAEVLHERLRQNDVDARWGGEEFVVLADGARLENAFLLAEQIREAVETASYPCNIQVTVSIGVAEYRAGETGDELLTRADNALYEAKRSGRNRVVAAEQVGHDPLSFASSTSPAPLFAASENAGQ